MNREEARAVIRDDPEGNVMRRLEALEVAKKDLGEKYTAGDLFKWAEGTYEQADQM